MCNASWRHSTDVVTGKKQSADPWPYCIGLNAGRCPHFKDKDAETVLVEPVLVEPVLVEPKKPKVGNGQAALIAISFGLGVAVSVVILKCLIAFALFQGVLQ
jgi:hypothetical protein